MSPPITEAERSTPPITKAANDPALEPGLEAAIDDSPTSTPDGAPSTPDAAAQARADERESLVPTDALTADDILAIVASASSFGLSEAEAQRYIEGLMSDRMIRYGLRMSQLEQTLAKMGLTMGGGELPPWLSVTIGLGVLGFGVYQHRSRYVQQPVQREIPNEDLADPDGLTADGLAGGVADTTEVGG